MKLFDPETVITKLFSLYGGKDKFFEMMDARKQEFFTLWEHESESIGRVLHAHLVVEHFLTAHLEAKNPNLAPLAEARLSFSQKISLISENDFTANLLKPGLICLNQVRNRLAHKLKIEIDTADITAILSVEIFSASLKHKQDSKLEDPLWILESFAIFSGTMLQSSAAPDSAIWLKAFESA